MARSRARSATIAIDWKRSPRQSSSIAASSERSRSAYAAGGVPRARLRVSRAARQRRSIAVQEEAVSRRADSAPLRYQPSRSKLHASATRRRLGDRVGQIREEPLDVLRPRERPRRLIGVDDFAGVPAQVHRSGEALHLEIAGLEQLGIDVGSDPHVEGSRRGDERRFARCAVPPRSDHEGTNPLPSSERRERLEQARIIGEHEQARRGAPQALERRTRAHGADTSLCDDLTQVGVARGVTREQHHAPAALAEASPNAMTGPKLCSRDRRQARGATGSVELDLAPQTL